MAIPLDATRAKLPSLVKSDGLELASSSWKFANLEPVKTVYKKITSIVIRTSEGGKRSPVVCAAPSCVRENYDEPSGAYNCEIPGRWVNSNR